MTCRPSLAARSARPSPTRRFRSSDSTTQGPAMRNGTEPKCGVIALFLPPGELGPAPDLRPGARVAGLASRPDEAADQRGRPGAARLARGRERAAAETGVAGGPTTFRAAAVARRPPTT